MAIHPSRIPLPTSHNRKCHKQPQYWHYYHTSSNLPPKSWELYIQSRHTARQERLWQDENLEKLRVFKATRTEHEPLGPHFLFENHKETGGVNTSVPGGRIVDFTSVLFTCGTEGERGGNGGRPAMFMDDVYPTRVPVWEKKERRISPLVPVPHSPEQKSERSGEEQHSVLLTREIEGERGGNGGRPAMFMDDVYPTRVPVWEKRERRISPLVPVPHSPEQKPEKSGEEQQESIEAMLERCRGARNYRKRQAQKELLRARRKEFLSEEISRYERVVVEGKMIEEGFPVHKDRD